MAGNDWLNGYLEAILDAGSGTRKRNDGRQKIAKFEQQVKEEKLFSPTKYFVEEVVNSFDESVNAAIGLRICAGAFGISPVRRNR